MYLYICVRVCVSLQTLESELDCLILSHIPLVKKQSISLFAHKFGCVWATPHTSQAWIAAKCFIQLL